MDFNRLFNTHHFALDWVQVEISTFCNCRCIYCPHAEYYEQWQNRHLPLGLFQRLVPMFEKTKLVHLQGWGEPFTHPLFFDMVRTAKQAGCLVGTTTNGTLLNGESIERVVGDGLDILGFSLAGVDQKNDFIRKGTQISKILRCLEEVQRVKERHRVHTPEIHIAYMLLHSGLDDLEKIPAFLANTEVSQMVISSLSLVLNPAMASESVLASSRDEYVELSHRMDHIRESSANLGTDLHFHMVSPFMDENPCSENISRALVVGSDGSVSPCVMAQVPVEGECFYCFRGQKEPLRRLVFGNIADGSLSEIWSQREYRQFVRAHFKSEVPDFCTRCNKRFIDMEVQ